MKQQNLFTFFKNPAHTKATSRKYFGGALSKGKRKARRPLDTKKPLHLVLRADTAKSGSLLKRQIQIDNALKKYAQKFQIKIIHPHH
jgi:hypothetical protein